MTTIVGIMLSPNKLNKNIEFTHRVTHTHILYILRSLILVENPIDILTVLTEVLCFVTKLRFSALKRHLTDRYHVKYSKFVCHNVTSSFLKSSVICILKVISHNSLVLQTFELFLFPKEKDESHLVLLKLPVCAKQSRSHRYFKESFKVNSNTEMTF